MNAPCQLLCITTYYTMHFCSNVLNTALEDFNPKETSNYILLAETISPERQQSILHIAGEVSQELLWATTNKYGVPHNIFLSPPVDRCLHCNNSLQLHNKPTTAVCYTPDGPLPITKLTLRCTKCCINYRYEQYGGTKLDGYRYYDTPREFIHASQVTYVHRHCHTLWGAAG